MFLAALVLGVGLALAAPAVAQTCTPASWVRLESGGVDPAAPGNVIADMAQRDVVLLGEEHDNADHHRWQLYTIAALHAARPDMAIGFESFPRSAQPVLDRWVRGELTMEQFLEQSRWRDVWRFPPELYQPLFEFARMHRVPMIALNVDRRFTRAVAQKGWEAVPESEREGVSRPAAPSPEYRDALFEVYAQHRPENGPPATKADAAFRHFVEAQQLWDRAMAEALARNVWRNERKRLAVGIMGDGHVRGGHGVPFQLRDLGIERVGTLLPVRASDCKELKPGLVDAVFLLPAQPAEEPRPRLGVQLEQGESGVRVAHVVPGSLAERSGLREGDLIVQLAGSPALRVESVIEAVRRQPPGTWLPLEVRRGEARREIVVRFPAEK